jgi:hypothetical protein
MGAPETRADNQNDVEKLSTCVGGSRSWQLLPIGFSQSTARLAITDSGNGSTTTDFPSTSGGARKTPSTTNVDSHNILCRS